MPGESLNFDITATDRASSKFRDVGDAALSASGKMDIAAASAKLWTDTTISQGRAADTVTASMKTHERALGLVADAENVLAGKATTTTKLMADQARQVEDAGKAAEGAAGGFTSLAGSGGIGGGGLVAVGAAAAAILGPVLAVSGIGLGGFVLAALAAGKNSKQLQQDLVPLKADFAAFQQELQPVVLKDFGIAAGVARTALHELEPAAAGAGKALGGVLGQVGADLKSQEFVAFFQFIGQQAGPDTQLLGQTFSDLLKVLPPVIQGLHSVSVEAFHDVNGILALIGGAEKLIAEEHRLQQAASDSSGWLGKFAHAAEQAAGDMVPGIQAGGHLAGALGKLGSTGNQAAAGTGAAALAAVKAHAPFFDLTTDVTKLNTQMTTLVGNLLTLQGDDVSWQQSLQAAQKQLASNTAGLEGNSAKTLANKQAVIASTNAAISFASNQLTLGKNIGQASTTIQKQIGWLQGLHDKSALVRQELAALRAEEAKLQAQKINQTISVQGLGQWSVSQSLAPGTGHRRASGGLVPGYGGGDKWPALLEGGEAIVPKHLTAAVAPFLRAHKVPGFAAGGLVPSYAGSVAMAPWVRTDDAATVRLIDLAVVKATVAGAQAAASAAASVFAAGPGGGAPAANAALARRMFPGQNFAAWNYVAMAESGWNQFARNPSSGAYGIPQALPPSKMGAAANPPQSNPAAQISWMNSYMNSVYGGATGAAAHEAAFHWYDRGGFLPTGPSLAMNNTGHPERVLPPGGSGAALHIENYNSYTGTDEALLAQKLSFAVVSASLGS